VKRAALYLLLSIWVGGIKIKRFFFPRGFRVVAIRRRCDACGRRLRPNLVKRQAVAPLCRKCLRAKMGIKAQKRPR
jgi:ribosomal protein S14